MRAFYQRPVQEYICCYIICNSKKLQTPKCPSAVNGQIQCDVWTQSPTDSCMWWQRWSLMQKDAHCLTPFIENFKNGSHSEKWGKRLFSGGMVIKKPREASAIRWCSVVCTQGWCTQLCSACNDSSDPHACYLHAVVFVCNVSMKGFLFFGLQFWWDGELWPTSFN